MLKLRRSPVVLGVDEGLDVRMVAAQHPHLRAAPRARRFHRFAGAVEHAHVGDRPGSAAVGALDQRILGADGGKIVTHAAAAAHGLRRLLQRVVDARLAVGHAADGIAHRLHEAIDEGGLQFGARGGIDASAGDEAVLQRPQELRLPYVPVPPRRRPGRAPRACARHGRWFQSPLQYFSRRTSGVTSCSGICAMECSIFMAVLVSPYCCRCGWCRRLLSGCNYPPSGAPKKVGGKISALQS